MLQQRIAKSTFSINWLLFLILVLLIMGIFFRFVNLDKKPYWHDETYTSLRISGYTRAELIQQVSERGVFDIKDLLKYQYPNSEKNVINVVSSLAAEDTHPPFHVLISQFWMQWFGNSVAVIRSLSAVVSLLALLCIYYLCIELFNSPTTGWVAICLLAVSPFHVLYAQEARPYSLLGLTILLSSTFLLRAMRLNTKLSWLFYATALTLGFYSHLFFILAAVGYGIYVVAAEGRLSRKLINYLLATSLSVLAFTPWIVTVALNFSSFKSASSWISTQKLTLLGAIRIWFENITLSFVDLGVGSYFHLGKFSLYFLLPPILLLVGYAIYFLYITTSKRTYLFIFTLIGVTALALIAADIVLGGNRQTWPRYIVACYLGIELAVAHLLANKITAVSVNLHRQKLWRIVTLVVISCGVFSCTISSQAESWWNNYGGNFHLQAARVINLTPQPLLLGDRSAFMGAMPLVYLLDAKVKFQYIVESNLPQSNNFSDVFLFYPSEELKSELKNQNYKLELLHKDNSSPLELWKVK